MEQGQNEQQTPAPQTQNPSPAESAVQKRDTLLVVGTYVLFFLPLVVVKIKNDPFFRYHMKQSLGLLLCWVVADIIFSLAWGLGQILELFVVVLWILGLVSALKGKQEPVPLLGKYFEKINI